MMSSSRRTDPRRGDPRRSDSIPPPLVPLWCTSVFSFLRGASHPDELVNRAVALGFPGIGLTDLDSLGGVVEAWQEVRRLRDEERVYGIENFRLVIGAEITVSPDLTPEADPATAAPRPAAAPPREYRLLLYAAGRQGYGNLAELISTGRLRSPKGESRVTPAEVAAFADDLLLVWTEDSGTAADLRFLLPFFPDRCWIGVSRHFRPADTATESRLTTLAAESALPVVALPRVLCAEPERREVHDVLTCIRLGTTLDDAADRLLPNGSFSLVEPTVLRRIYQDRPEWCAETARLAARCAFTLDEIEYRYPSETRPDGWTDIAWLRELTREGARRRYPGGVPPEIAAQLTKELDLIEELDYSGYFLTMAEIVMFCRREGILCQGRGSAANSAVCFCLGITAIDPIRMDLLFERFISRERAEPPDIDLDIEHRRREEVIQHVYRSYGRDHAAMVANLVRFRRRSAVREVGATFGFSEITLDQMAKLLGHRSLTIAEAAVQVGLDTDRPRVAAFLRIAEAVRGIPRHLSIHPGGFLLGRDPVARIVPQENATMEGRTVIQWDKHGVEDMNLFKVDLLGLGALTHLDFAFRLLERHLGVSMSMASIPMDVPRVYAMLRKADTVGVFQLESRAQMAMLPRLRPQEFYDLVVEISIVRPGPITGGMVHPYLRRRRGEEPVEYPHPNLEPILAKTLGVPLFQEQVMKLAMVAADYTPGEADQLRRDMAAWRKTGQMEKHQATIIERMVAKGIERDFAERVFEQIRGFGEYGFPESHAASFSLIAYATAWVRAFYPTVFTCALLNAWPMGFYSPASIVADARRHGLVLRPVDVLFSQWECTLEPVSPGADRDFAIRMGARFVKGLGPGEWEKVRRARSDGAAADGETDSRWVGTGADGVARFLRHAGLDADARLVLSQAGAFRSFSSDRRAAVWESLDWMVGTAPLQPDPDGTGEASGEDRTRLFVDGSADAQPVHLQGAPMDQAEEIAWDYLASIHSTAAHPLEPYRAWLSERAYPTAAAVRRLADRAEVSVIGMVICRQRPETAGGTVFMTLEDETGFVNLVIWRDRFEELRSVVLTGSFLGIRGRVQNAEGVVHVVVTDAWHAELPHHAVATGSRDFH